MCLNPVTLRAKKKTGRMLFQHDDPEKNYVVQYNLKGAHQAKLHIVGCGKCTECESKRRGDWAFRMEQETLDYPNPYFVLLTYANECVPSINTDTGQYSEGITFETLGNELVLQKKHVQDFIKRLRQRQKRKTGQEPIRYFAVGEYGEEDNTRRPHYHLILWNLHPTIAEELKAGRIWKQGYAYVRIMKTDTPAGFMYVTKYVYKQQNKKEYSIPPFVLMSKKPIIGNRYIKNVIRGKGMIRTKGMKERPVPSSYNKYLPTEAQKIISKTAKQRAYDKIEEEAIDNWRKTALTFHQNKQQIRHAKNRKNVQ